MTRHKAFETAAARRREDPIVWTIDGRDVMLRASVDLAAIGSLVDTLQEIPQEGGGAFGAAIKKRAGLLGAIKAFVLAESMPDFDAVADDLDFRILSQMSTELIREYSGAGNPTRPESSSDGSEATGESLTDGAQPEELTLSLSLSTEP